jgi:hypothetical protein
MKKNQGPCKYAGNDKELDSNGLSMFVPKLRKADCPQDSKSSNWRGNAQEIPRSEQKVPAIEA